MIFQLSMIQLNFTRLPLASWRIGEPRYIWDISATLKVRTGWDVRASVRLSTRNSRQDTRNLSEGVWVKSRELTAP